MQRTPSSSMGVPWWRSANKYRLKGLFLPTYCCRQWLQELGSEISDQIQLFYTYIWLIQVFGMTSNFACNKRNDLFRLQSSNIADRNRHQELLQLVLKSFLLRCCQHQSNQFHPSTIERHHYPSRRKANTYLVLRARLDYLADVLEETLENKNRKWLHLWKLPTLTVLSLFLLKKAVKRSE